MSQHMDALAMANRTRLAQAELHREVDAAGDVAHRRSNASRHARMGAVADVLDAECVQSMRLVKLLGWAATDREIARLLAHVGVQGVDRRVRDLTDRQREVLCHALRSPDALRGRQAAA